MHIAETALFLCLCVAKSLTDVEHDGQRRRVHLAGQFAVGSEWRAFDQMSNEITLVFGCLPDAQILESIDGHARYRARSVP